jgi:hypothetical protein
MPEAKEKGNAADYRTITRSIAADAIRAYNTDSYYSANKGLNLDRRARQLFTKGLAPTRESILEQVHFIGKDYGGVAGFPAAVSLATVISNDIYAVRVRYSDLAETAAPLRQAPSSVKLITELFAPFVKQLHRKKNWQVWATKFWHFLNSDAFPIEDRRVDNFFGIDQLNSPQKYVALLNRFRDFDLTHQSWLPHLRTIDGGHAWCDNKLWDKMCYGVVEIAKPRAS